MLFVHAHPDDETISTGGTIALLTDAGVPVSVLTCTRGERGEVIPQELKHLEGHGTELGKHRELEIAEAMRILGVTDHRFLGTRGARDVRRQPRTYEDSGMQWGAHGAEAVRDAGKNSMAEASLGELIGDVITVIDELRPRAVISYDSTGGYGHPDHVRAHLVSLAASEEFGVPFFEIVPPGEDGAQASDAALREVDVSSVIERKIAALGAYRTQLTVGDGTITHTGGQVEPIATLERFRELGALESYGVGLGRDAAAQNGGLGERLVTGTLAFIGGVALGVLGTSVHSLNVTVANVPVWSGAALALVFAFLLLVGLRLRYDTRWPAGLAAVGILASTGVLSLEGPGGSVMIMANGPGWLWLYGPIVVALVVVVWPRFRGPRRDTMVTSSASLEEGDSL